MADERRTSLSVIVPVYNEQHLVEASLHRLLVLGESPLLARVQVIVVDDASTDTTPACLARFEAALATRPGGTLAWRFLRHERNQGKGAAVRTGLALADAELTVIHDADLEYHPRDLLRMLPLFLDEDADAVFGSRFAAAEFRRALFFRHQLGNKLLTFLCDLVSDLNISDMETCYKMVRTRLLRSIPLESRDFRIEPELTIKLAKRGARLYEVPISYSGRTYQEGKKIGWKDGVRALGAIARFAVSDDVYTADAPLGTMLARVRRAPRLSDWLADVVRPHAGQSVLELAAGIGTLTTRLTPRERYWATDPNPLYLDALRHLRRNRPYLRTALVDPADARTFPAGERFDTVVCVNVLESVDDDVAVLTSARGVLDDGGRVLVMVPAGPRLYGTLDEALGRWRRYTPAQLTAVAHKAGFRVTRLHGVGGAGVPLWWAGSTLLKRRRLGLAQTKLLNLLVPLLRAVDGAVSLPPLSLFAVLEESGPGDDA